MERIAKYALDTRTVDKGPDERGCEEPAVDGENESDGGCEG